MTPFQRFKMMRVWRLRWWRKQREKYYGLGLRSDGKPRRSERRPISPSDRPAHVKRLQKIRYRRFIERRHAKGLSARGNSLERTNRLTEMQKLYLEIKSQNT